MLGASWSLRRLSRSQAHWVIVGFSWQWKADSTLLGLCKSALCLQRTADNVEQLCYCLWPRFGHRLPTKALQTSRPWANFSSCPHVRLPPSHRARCFLGCLLSFFPWELQKSAYLAVLVAGVRIAWPLHLQCVCVSLQPRRSSLASVAWVWERRPGSSAKSRSFSCIQSVHWISPLGFGCLHDSVCDRYRNGKGDNKHSHMQ